MKINQKGFSVVEILSVLVVVGLISGAGWYVWQAKNKKNIVPTPQQAKQDITSQDEAQTATPYTFKELGISMDILNGWEVKTNHTKQEDVNFYSWTVEKAGADGKISLRSSGFKGGFSACNGVGSFSPAVVREVAPTQNANLMFMSWSYSYDNELNNRTSIVPTSETVFRTTNNDSAAAILNKDIKAGNYFFCLSEPQAGFSLKLNNEAAPGFLRTDSIAALSSNSSDDKYIPVSASARSFADIKVMLTTIK